jgi:hypothetical protein
MLFGDFFDGAIVVREAHATLAGWPSTSTARSAFALHGFVTRRSGWRFAGFALATYIYLFNPSRRQASSERWRGRSRGSSSASTASTTCQSAVFAARQRQTGPPVLEASATGGDRWRAGRRLGCGTWSRRRRGAPLQSGFLYHYAFAMILGLIVCSAPLGVAVTRTRAIDVRRLALAVSLLIWLPIAGGFATLAFGDRAPARAGFALLVAWPPWRCASRCTRTSTGQHRAMQFVERTPWIAAYDIRTPRHRRHFALPLIAADHADHGAGDDRRPGKSVDDKPTQYYAAFLILEGLMIGVFCALDAMLFYVFFEGMLIPMFIIIGVWGGPRRVYATMKFFLYTFLGSVFMLVGLIYLYLKGGSFQLADMQACR